MTTVPMWRCPRAERRAHCNGTVLGNLKLLVASAHGIVLEVPHQRSCVPERNRGSPQWTHDLPVLDVRTSSGTYNATNGCFPRQEISAGDYGPSSGANRVLCFPRNFCRTHARMACSFRHSRPWTHEDLERLLERFGDVGKVFRASLTELEAARLPAASAQSIALGSQCSLPTRNWRSCARRARPWWFRTTRLIRANC